MYEEKDKIRHKIGSKTGLKDVVLSLYYEEYAKALINVGEDMILLKDLWVMAWK